MTQTTEAAAAAEDNRPTEEHRPRRSRRMSLHRAWFVAAVAFVTITGAAAFRSLPGLLIDPLHEEFTW